MPKTTLEWSEYVPEWHRRKLAARRAVFAAVSGSILAFAGTEISEVYFGAPHLSIIAYGITALLTLWSWVCIRRFRNLRYKASSRRPDPPPADDPPRRPPGPVRSDRRALVDAE